MTKHSPSEVTDSRTLTGGIGERRLRVEDRPLLTGSASFVDDLPFQDGLEVAFVRSPVAHGTLVDAGVDAARGLPGVEAILVAEDLDLGPLVPPNDNPSVEFTRDEGEVAAARGAAAVGVERPSPPPRHSGLQIDPPVVLGSPAGV